MKPSSLIRALSIITVFDGALMTFAFVKVGEIGLWLLFAVAQATFGFYAFLESVKMEVESDK